MSRALALLVLLVQCVPCTAEELGRLFFSPAERAALDAERSAKAGNPPVVASAPAPVRIDGYVLRSGGQTTLWIDGRLQRLQGTVGAPGPGDRPEARESIGDQQRKARR